MNPLIRRLSQLVTSFWRDESGILLPYVTVMLVAIVGFALLALDGSRFMSLQTQMQAAADSLALAGARELNQRAGAQGRAINAMASASIGNTNTLSGMGTAPTFAYTYTFYQSIPDAATGFTGTVPTGSQEQQDIATKFVAVTITPVTISTILPVKFLNSAGTNHFTAGAQAIAGFTSITVCQVTPIFMCNPYETSGMTDTQATQALISALDPNDPSFNAATLRRQFQLNRSGISPGNFGWVQTADGCNNSSCMRTNIASSAGACYHSFTVNLATGNKNNVEPYFDTRFDIYNQSPAPAVSAANAPSVNVRKGYVPTSTTNQDWCSTQPDALAALNPSAALTEAFYTAPMVTTTGTTTLNSPSISSVGNTANIAVGEYVYGAGITFGTTVSSISGSTVGMSANATGANTGLTFYLPTPAGSAGIPQNLNTTNGSNSLTAVSITTTGDTKKNNSSLTNVASIAGICQGATVTGAGIPANTTVSSPPSGTTVALSNRASATAPGVSLTFSGCVNVSVGQFVAGAGIPASTTVTAVSSSTVTISNNATATGASVPLAFFWLESPLLQDSQWNGVCSNGFCAQGNGDWNCLLYWKVNHASAAAPAGCTASNPTISRYQVYRYEIANSLINDWSGNHAANTSGSTGNGENGAPLCAAASGVSGIDTTTGGTDRRNIIVPIINCLAQNVAGQGSTATVPAAGFGKFFMTQPWSAQSTNLYGEMTGLVGLNDNVTIMNQVQLYR